MRLTENLSACRQSAAKMKELLKELLARMIADMSPILKKSHNGRLTTA